VRIAAVDDDVALVQQWRQFVDHGIDRRSGLDQDEHAARRLERIAGLDHPLSRRGLGREAADTPDRSSVGLFAGRPGVTDG